jgi:hypothetical protein
MGKVDRKMAPSGLTVRKRKLSFPYLKSSLDSCVSQSVV